MKELPAYDHLEWAMKSALYMYYWDKERALFEMSRIMIDLNVINKDGDDGGN